MSLECGLSITYTLMMICLALNNCIIKIIDRLIARDSRVSGLQMRIVGVYMGLVMISLLSGILTGLVIVLDTAIEWFKGLMSEHQIYALLTKVGILSLFCISINFLIIVPLLNKISILRQDNSI